MNEKRSSLKTLSREIPSNPSRETGVGRGHHPPLTDPQTDEWYVYRSSPKGPDGSLELHGEDVYLHPYVRACVLLCGPLSLLPFWFSD